jgi:hypothetical protein
MNWSMMDEDIALIPVVAVQTAEKRTFSDSLPGWAAYCSILRHDSCRLARLSMHADAFSCVVGHGRLVH